jgi:hypothetical protein
MIPVLQEKVYKGIMNISGEKTKKQLTFFENHIEYTGTAY